jgi:hypothetical protein
MSGIREPRIVELRSSGPESYGSGYLLGNGIVLTARHVLFPDTSATPPDRLEIEVRSVGMTRQRDDPVLATLEWPPKISDLAVHSPDIALIRVTDPRLVLKPPPLRLIGSPDMPFAPVLKVHAIGFPVLAAMSGGGRDTAQLSGVVQPGAGQVTDILQISELVFGGTSGDRPPDRDSDWKGFSGAALFTSEPPPGAPDALTQLIGVVVIHASGKRYDFAAARVDALLDDPAAAALLNQAVEQPSAAARIDANIIQEAPPIHRMVCLIDRTDQEQEFVVRYQQALPTAQTPLSRPMIALLPGAGDAGHAAMEMVKRLEVRTLPEKLRWPSDYVGAALLYWPVSSIKPAEAVARLRADLWNQLAGTGPPPEDAAAYVRLWKDGTRPRLFVSPELLKRPLDAGAAKTLSAWSKFWASLQTGDHCVPVHLLLLNASQSAVDTWLRTVSHSKGVVIGELPELGKCHDIDLDAWFSNELPVRLHQSHRPFLSRMETTLRKEYAEPFYLRHLKIRVQELVNEEFYG